MECHVHIWQMSPQLSCSDICHIWMWFESVYLYNIEKFPNGEISEGNFSNPQPRWGQFQAAKYCFTLLLLPWVRLRFGFDPWVQDGCHIPCAFFLTRLRRVTQQMRLISYCEVIFYFIFVIRGYGKVYLWSWNPRWLPYIKSIFREYLFVMHIKLCCYRDENIFLSFL